MAELFQTTRNNITLHIGNIFKEGELEQISVCKDSLLTASDGKKYKTKFYSHNYIDETVLWLLTKRNIKVDATIYTAKISKELKIDIEKHNKQYRPIQVRTFSKSHDRFLIIYALTVYHIGASLKDLGKKPVVSEVESMVCIFKNQP